jgi:hypothetical protein
LEGQRALRLPLKEERGDWRDWSAYAKQVRQSGFDILEVNGQPAAALHMKSGEMSDLALLQPGGINAPGLRYLFTSPAELDQRLQQQA